jgi:DNA processing protein
MHDDELSARLLLRSLPGIGARGAWRMLERYGSARRALAAGPLSGPARSALRDPRLRGRVAAWLREVRASRWRTLDPRSSSCPEPVRQLADPPIVLFAAGRVGLLRSRRLAIVGTRRATAYGLAAAQRFARACARSGIVVVSGLARGIDAAAHRAALAEGGATIAVLGTGLDVAYPREHDCLQQAIALRGLLLSELAPGTAARPHTFPQRNRIMAAVSDAVLVVEAPARSGALITVRHALDLGLSVFAVPGPIDRSTSEGTLALIRDGAGFAAAPQDVFDGMGWPCMEPAAAGGGAGTPVSAEVAVAAPIAIGGRAARVAARVLAAIDPDGSHVDELVAGTGRPAAEVLAGLLELELAGRVRRLPGDRFIAR